MTTPFASAMGNWNGREDAIKAGRCVDPPIGCGKRIPNWGRPELPMFRDEASAREYRITGMCQQCQDHFEEWALQQEEESDDGEFGFYADGRPRHPDESGGPGPVGSSPAVW